MNSRLQICPKCGLERAGGSKTIKKVLQTSYLHAPLPGNIASIWDLSIRDLSIRPLSYYHFQIDYVLTILGAGNSPVSQSMPQQSCFEKLYFCKTKMRLGKVPKPCSKLQHQRLFKARIKARLEKHYRRERNIVDSRHEMTRVLLQSL